MIVDYCWSVKRVMVTQEPLLKKFIKKVYYFVKNKKWLGK